MAKIIMNELFDEWLNDKKNYVKRSTISTYSLVILNHLKPYFGNLSFDNIEENSIQKYVFDKMNSGLGQKTVKDTVVVLKMILKYGSKKYYGKSFDIDVRYPISTEKKEIQVLSIVDYKKIMSYIETNFNFKNLGIYVCLSAGLRIGEVCALKWEDFDILNGTISINKTIQRIYNLDNSRKRTEIIIDVPKSINSIRQVPMSRGLCTIIKTMKKLVNDNYYMITNDIKPTEPRTYRNYYKKLMRKLEIPEIKFHGLRHSFATRCIESNCDYKTVSVILGHSNISTTLNLYVHPDLEQKKKCINNMFNKINKNK